MADLSPRQREVLQRLSQGHDEQRIAQALGLSLGTVQAHRRLALGRLGVDLPAAMALVKWLA